MLYDHYVKSIINILMERTYKSTLKGLIEVIEFFLLQEPYSVVLRSMEKIAPRKAFGAIWDKTMVGTEFRSSHIISMCSTTGAILPALEVMAFKGSL